MMTPALPLALIPIGTPTGLIVNVGYHDTSVICVYEGLFSLTLFSGILCFTIHKCRNITFYDYVVTNFMTRDYVITNVITRDYVLTNVMTRDYVTNVDLLSSL